MQMDPGFAERVFARDAQAVASTGLSEADLALLLAADPVAVRADRDRKRLRQMLGNVAAEFELSLAVAPDRDALLEGFPASEGFHAAVRTDASLPLAFGERVRADAAAGESLRAAIAGLEVALAHARRSPRPVDPPAPGELVLAPWAHLVDLPAGTHAAAMEIRLALEAGGAPAPAPSLAGEGLETLLVVADPEGAAHRLPDARVEEVVGPVARLLRRARLALDAEARGHLAALLDVSPRDLDAFAATLVEERVLLAG